MSVSSEFPDPVSDANVLALMGGLLQSQREVTAPGGAASLRTSHYRLLAAIGARSVRIATVGQRLGMTTQGAGQLVAQLVASGDVSVEEDPADGRARLVTVTAQGRATLRRVERRIATVERRWEARVGVQRYAAFRTVLEDLAAAEGSPA